MIRISRKHVARYAYFSAVVILSVSTALSPLFSLLTAHAEARDTTSNAASLVALRARAAQMTSRPHKPDELIVRFRREASAEAKTQLLNIYGRAFKKMRGQEQDGFPGAPAPTGGGPNSIANSRIGKLMLKEGLNTSIMLPTLLQMAELIEWVEPNYLVSQSTITMQAQPSPNDPRFGEQWALNNIGQNGGVFGADIHASQGWQKTTGSRQTAIAIIDTGMNMNHPDLRNNLWANQREEKGKANEDDDRDGFTDDINGWNFVGDNNYEAVKK